MISSKTCPLSIGCRFVTVKKKIAKAKKVRKKEKTVFSFVFCVLVFSYALLVLFFAHLCLLSSFYEDFYFVTHVTSLSFIDRTIGTRSISTSIRNIPSVSSTRAFSWPPASTRNILTCPFITATSVYVSFRCSIFSFTD